MSNTALPASRVDALTVIAVSLFSLFFGATPKKGKTFSLISSILGHVWAVASSVITFKDILGDELVEPHLQFFTYVLLVSTIFSSSLMVWALVSASEDGTDDVDIALGWGLLGVIVALLSGLTALCLAFFSGCDDVRLHGSQFCDHSAFAVVGAIVVALVVSVVLGLIVVGATFGNTKGVCQTCCCGGDDVETSKSDDMSTDTAVAEASQFTDAATLEEQRPRVRGEAKSETGAVMTRWGTLVKVCLLGVYWFLVDDDLSWETFRGHDANWWATGQYAKHGVTIINNFFNQLPC